jgi:hypothetical protein
MSKENEKFELPQAIDEKFGLPQAIEEWKKLGITSCTMTFSCGGDSMDDYSFEFNKMEDGKSITIESSELNNFFDGVIFNKVEFYENSDGHYMGEAGTVEITLNEDEDDFDYCKSSTAETNEEFTETTVCDLTEEEKTFLRSKVVSVNGGYDDATTFLYKKDCMLSNAEIEIRNNLGDKLCIIGDGYKFQESQGEEQEWHSWIVENISDDDITMEITRTFTVYSEVEN